jgi:mitochondrial import inner membrane translocase subunit TIM16
VEFSSNTAYPRPSPAVQQYKKFFDANDPKNGGSFYLQSKIYRAKECLDNELKAEEKTKDGEKGTEGTTEKKDSTP